MPSVESGRYSPGGPIMSMLHEKPVVPVVFIDDQPPQAQNYPVLLLQTRFTVHLALLLYDDHTPNNMMPLRIPSVRRHSI